VGPLGVAVVLALVPAVALGATIAIRQMSAPHPPQAVTPPQRPTAAPTPRPALRSTVTTGGVDVVYWANWDGVRAAPFPLHAVDWSGGDRGEIDLPPSTAPGAPNQQPVAIAAPDGSALLVDTDVYTAAGTWLSELPYTGDLRWADDSRHVCHLRSKLAGTGGVEVDLLGVDGAVWASSLGRTTDQRAGQTATLLSCSATQMRADVLLTGKVPGVDTVLLQLDLRGGGLDADQTVCTGACIESPLASADGRELAYVDPTDDALHMLTLTAADATHKRLDISGTPVAFTGDGAALLVELEPPHGVTTLSEVPGLRLVDWRTGAVLWSRGNSQTLPEWGFALPAAGALAVAACDYAPSAGAFPSGQCSLNIVSAAGVATAGRGLDAAFGWGPF